MQTFVWGEDFYTGIATVDEQHHALVDLFNALSETMAENASVDEAAIQLVFSQLMDYGNIISPSRKR